MNANDSNAQLQTRLERGRRRVEAASRRGTYRLATRTDRVRSVNEFARELEVLARRTEFNLEIDGGKAELNFYAWDPELPRPKARPHESRAMSSNG